MKKHYQVSSQKKAIIINKTLFRALKCALSKEYVLNRVLTFKGV